MPHPNLRHLLHVTDPHHPNQIVDVVAEPQLPPAIRELEPVGPGVLVRHRQSLRHRAQLDSARHLAGDRIDHRESQQLGQGDLDRLAVRRWLQRPRPRGNRNVVEHALGGRVDDDDRAPILRPDVDPAAVRRGVGYFGTNANLPSFDSVIWFGSLPSARVPVIWPVRARRSLEVPGLVAGDVDLRAVGRDGQPVGVGIDLDSPDLSEGPGIHLHQLVRIAQGDPEGDLGGLGREGAGPNPAWCLSPAKSIEKRGDLGRGAIRIFAMWEMPHLREWRKVQVDERLAEPIGPFVWE